jgi:acid phosphatase (class A)
MRNMTRCGWLVLGLWLAAAGASAKDKEKSKEKAEVGYLSARAIDVGTLLPAPPTLGSAEAKAELEALYWIQCHRTAEQMAAAQADARVNLATYRRVLGTWCAADNLPRTQRLIKRVEHDANVFCEQGKTLFGRKRPEFEDRRIRVAVARETSPAYPSFHATRGILYALVLAELVPEKKDALLERGREVGFSREVGGVHHPSDVYAGRVLGQAVARALLANPQFRADLARAKTEVDAARTAAAK